MQALARTSPTPTPACSPRRPSSSKRKCRCGRGCSVSRSASNSEALQGRRYSAAGLEPARVEFQAGSDARLFCHRTYDGLDRRPIHAPSPVELEVRRMRALLEKPAVRPRRCRRPRRWLPRVPENRDVLLSDGGQPALPGSRSPRRWRRSSAWSSIIRASAACTRSAAMLRGAARRAARRSRHSCAP